MGIGWEPGWLAWARKGCQFSHACKPKLPRLALVA